MPAMAIGGAVTSMAAQNIGAGNWDRVNKITWTGVGFNVLVTGVIVICIHLFNREAVGLFLPHEGKAIDLGVHINNITLWSFILFGVFSVVAGVVRASGAVMVPLIVTFIALLVIRIPLAYILSYQSGFDSIWWSFPISFAIAVLFNLLYYTFGKWRQAKIMPTSKAA
jgi:Na+-driven multidrug efflux pump